jgi:hypothetical protein
MRYKLLMLLLLGMFLVSFVNASPTITLNSPADGSTSLTTSVTFNATANVTGGAYLTNMSFCSNITGSWECEGTMGIVGEEDLISYYKLDETTGDVIDSQGTNDGTNNGATRGVTGKINNAFSFLDGDYVTILDESYKPDVFTISLWYNMNDISGWVGDQLISKRQDSSNRFYLMLCNVGEKNEYRLSFQGNGNSLIKTFGNIEKNVWVHFVMVFDEEEIRFYENGEKIYTVTKESTNGINWNGNWYLGKEDSYYIDDGDLDEVGIWDRTLSSTEVENLYNSGDGARPGGTNNATTTLTKTISDTTLWNVQACDSDGDCSFASSNFTVTLDSIAPTIAVSSGNGTQDYGSLTQNHTINFTATDSNLDSCWINYNSTNRSVSCTSGVLNSYSFELVQDLYTATIYANDTVGNLRASIVNWDYIFFEEGSDFEDLVFETEFINFQMNITTSVNILTASGKLVYNGVENSVTGNCTLGKCVFEEGIDIPLVTSGVYQDRNFYWDLTLFDGTTNYDLITDEKTQNTSRIYLEECGGSFTTQTLNFTAYQETNLTMVNPFYIAGTFDFWLGSGNIKRNSSFNKASTSNLSLCLSPVDRTIYSDAHIEYDYTDENITYIRRNYYLDNSSLTNTSQDIELLLLENSDSTSFIIEVKDQKLSPVEDAYVYIQRYYPTDGTFRTVQVAKTDSNGETIGFYKTETVNYKHLIIQDGVVLLETTPQKVVGKTAPFTLSFTVGDPLGYPWDPFLKDSNIQSTLTYNKTSEIVTFTYIDTTGSTTLGRLVVLKESLSNYTTTVICNTSSTQSSVTLTCNMSGYSGTFNAYAYIEGESTDILSFVITTARDIMGNEGLLLGFFIILVAGFAFIWNPSAGIIGINVAVIFVNIIGFITVSPVFIFGMIAVSFITIILLKT